MRRFAQNTSVSSEKSRFEIERTLQRYGASQFVYGTRDGQAVLGFFASERYVRFNLPLPTRDKAALTSNGRRRPGGEAAIERAHEQSTRQAWRALALVVKAKLEAVSSTITTFEDEFMAHIVLPGGMTVAETIRPRIAESYKHGKAIALLPDFSQRSK
jgi:hypothetical protein